MGGHAAMLRRSFGEAAPIAMRDCKFEGNRSGRERYVCGFAGYVDFGGTPENREALDSAREALHQRGPDGQGEWRSAWAALVHTRLAVIDLDSRSDQPFSSPDGRHMLVYNGEVYNYRELRAELRDRWTFRTQGDTEVVLAALVEWGPRAFERFNGMWALALLDTQERHVLLSRDRFGVKPLVYSRNGQRTVFGSTIAALRRFLHRPLEPDMLHLSRYLVTAASHIDHRTFYRGVCELEPGTWVRVRETGLSSGRYWHLPRPEAGRGLVVDELKATTQDAVRLRMRADVPLAVTLSSGLDSSLIATVMADAGGATRAYTARFATGDESTAARRYASLLGMHWESVDIPSILDAEFLQSRIIELDGPNASPAANALWIIMKAIRNSGRKVVLEGQGADEVFGGYASIVGPFWLKNRAQAIDPPGVALAWRGLAHDLGARSAITHSVRRLVPGVHGVYQRRLGIGGSLKGALDQPVSPSTTPGMSAEQVLHASVNDVLRSLLHYGDRMSMAHGVEARQPFLDYRIVEQVSRSDIALRFGHGRGKQVLRDVGAGILRSRAPIDAPKVGFPVPTLQWMRVSDNRDIVLNGRLVAAGLLDRSRVADLLRVAAQGSSSMRTQSAYRLLTAELWWRSEGW